MDFGKKAVFSETIYSQLLDGELVLLDMKTENYFGLDAVGVDIWKLLEEGNTLQQTLDVMLGMYEVGPDQLRRDLESLIGKLLSSGLIELK